MKRTPINVFVKRELVDARARQRNYGFVSRVLRPLTRLANVGPPQVSVYGVPVVQFSPSTGFDARPVALAAHALLKAAGLAHPLAAGSATAMHKSFDEYAGKIVYTIPTSTPVKVVVRGGDATCKIRTVTTQETVPAADAYTATRTKYVIENPEECMPSRSRP